MEPNDSLPPFPDMSDLPVEAKFGGFELGKSHKGF
jgi:hypothetical protein